MILFQRLTDKLNLIITSNFTIDEYSSISYILLLFFWNYLLIY